MQAKKMDWITFTITFVVLIAVCIPLGLYPEKGGEMLTAASKFFTNTFGISYLWLGIGVFFFLLWVAYGRYGTIKLGEPGERPAFSTFSWASMLFCAGIGASILYWGTIEWAYYYESPPFGLQPGSTEAIEWAATYGIFHWGPTAWAIYCLPAVPIAYLYHVRKKPVLKISEACRPFIGKAADGILGKMIDILFMFGLLGAAGTTLGLGTPMISAGISKMTGIPESFGLNIGVLLIVTTIFSFSAYSGLQKGIKWLSDMNMVLTFLLLTFILVVGPTLFILKMGTNSVGLLLDNILRMSLWTDPITKSGFPERWTMFYWSWWLVYSPFVGLFIARISRGRTIRQMIIGTLVWGTIGCTVYFVILGNYAIYLQLNDILPVLSILQESGAPTAIISVMNTLPFNKIMVPLFCILAIIFLATTFDSSAYVLAAVTQKRVDNDPLRWNRMFWAFALSLLPMVLMFIGGLETLQTASILTALPLVFITLLLILSFVKAVQQDEKKKVVAERKMFWEAENTRIQAKKRHSEAGMEKKAR
ncbi:BCCT family transporter [Aneurinibacillus thermoaerophilus]|uniref:BCCT family transporter n=1 Tax=Aneurinibacillus thermoaerophilus TaxID=143495 RepID=UPI002E1F7301|nr:BCCT family transporter [Aneurinibacillus thermoaerophilus]MED0765555.1 BCCT family transporter [Aneurinibacillus thermoaerophilus]